MARIVRWISPGSRSASAQCRSSTSSLRATSAGSVAKRLHASAYQATSRRVFRSPLPPTRIRGRGLLTGFGEQMVSASR